MSDHYLELFPKTEEELESELLKAATENYWKVVNAWAKTYEPKDKGSQYAFDVVYSKKYLSCKAMINTCKRHVLYMYKYYHENDFKFEYNSARVNYLHEWWETNLFLTEGRFKGQPFRLADNQAFKIAELYGWNFKGKNNIFMTSKMYDVETRKNGKSQFFAGLSDLVVLNPFGNDAQPEVYFSGPKQDSSNTLYTKAQQMAKSNENLSSEFDKINTRNFVTYADGKIKALPYSVDALEGKNPSLVIGTEYHLHPNDEMINSAESASNDSRPNSLVIFDTTKGYGINGVAYVRELSYKDLINHQVNIDPFNTTSYNIFAFIAEVDKEDSPNDIMNPWETNPLRKSTPMLGVTLQLESLQNEWREARNNPTKRREFLIKKFGMWVGNLQGLVTIDDIQGSNTKQKLNLKIEDLEKQPCVIGVDLAMAHDTNAVSIIFKNQVDMRDVLVVIPKVFVPRDTVLERIEKEQLPYQQWIQDGHVIRSGDKTVDYKDIAEYIANACLKYDVKAICFDPYQSMTVKYHLTEARNIPTSLLKDVPQSAKELSAPMSLITQKILDKEYLDFDNPIQLSQILNVKPIITSSGGLYFKKDKSTGRIDLFAAMTTAVSEFAELPAINSKDVPMVTSWNFS